MTGLNSKMWCVMLTRIGLFILQQFLHIGCLRIVIANGPTHSLKGDSAGPEDRNKNVSQAEYSSQRQWTATVN